jgi:hypothetical protein
MTHITYEQAEPMSCGAASLMVAAAELGVEGDVGISDRTETTFEVSAFMEGLIYDVTSSHADELESPSMPDGIAVAAQRLGLEVSVSMSGCLVPRYLSRQYPNVERRLGELGVTVSRGTPTLDADERMLVLVHAISVGLHYVLYRPDRSYMDPATGRNHNGTLWGMSQGPHRRYIDTGVYIVLRK